MKQLKAVTQYLISLNVVAAEDLDSWTEEVKFELMLKDRGVGGLTMGQLSYTAVIWLRNFDHKANDPIKLFCQVGGWLVDNDGDRPDGSDASLQIDVDVLEDGLGNDDTADVTLSIGFVEEIGIVPDESGDIRVAGTNYRLGEPEIWVAEEGDVVEPVDVVFDPQV